MDPGGSLPSREDMFREIDDMRREMERTFELVREYETPEVVAK